MMLRCEGLRNDHVRERAARHGINVAPAARDLEHGAAHAIYACAPEIMPGYHPTGSNAVECMLRVVANVLVGVRAIDKEQVDAAVPRRVIEPCTVAVQAVDARGFRPVVE